MQQVCAQLLFPLEASITAKSLLRRASKIDYFNRNDPALLLASILLASKVQEYSQTIPTIIDAYRQTMPNAALSITALEVEKREMDLILALGFGNTADGQPRLVGEEADFELVRSFMRVMEAIPACTATVRARAWENLSECIWLEALENKSCLDVACACLALAVAEEDDNGLRRELPSNWWELVGASESEIEDIAWIMYKGERSVT